MLTVTKIKLTESRKRIAINWEVISEDGKTNLFTLDCADEPRQGLYDALNKLLSMAIASCHLDQCVWEEAAESDRAFVSGVSLKYPEDGFGINITAQYREAEDGRTVVINTPYIGPDFIGWQEDEWIKRLISEAEGYIKDDRKTQQLDLLEATV